MWPCWLDHDAGRRQDHDHLPSLQFGKLLDLGQFDQLVADPVKDLGAKILMGHFTATKPQGHVHLVAFLQELAHRPHLHTVIIVVDVGTQLDFLDLDYLLLLPRLILLFLDFVFVFSIIQNLADRRIALGDTSTRSRPTSTAIASPSRIETTPTISPSASISRMVRESISALTRGPSWSLGAVTGGLPMKFLLRPFHNKTGAAPFGPSARLRRPERPPRPPV